MKTFKPFVRRSSGVSRIVRDGYSNSNTGTSWWDIRKEVFKRDSGVCQERGLNGICGKPGVDVHHIRPLSRSGKTEKSNLITLCEEHHQSKHRHELKKK